MKFLTTIFITLFLNLPVEWSNDFEKAKVEATQAKKYILINFAGSDWCGPCIKLRKEILDSEEFTKYASEHLVLVRADFPRLKKNQLSKEQTARNEALADKYNQEGKFPLTVLTDANGKVIKEWEGFPEKSASPNAFVHEINTIIKK
jgi:thioredoxin-related protein